MCMQSTAYYTSNIYVNNCFLWQARIQLDMQYLHIKIHCSCSSHIECKWKYIFYIYNLYIHLHKLQLCIYLFFFGSVSIQTNRNSYKRSHTDMCLYICVGVCVHAHFTAYAWYTKKNRNILKVNFILFWFRWHWPWDTKNVLTRYLWW